jgi:hypothetical protein
MRKYTTHKTPQSAALFAPQLRLTKGASGSGTQAKLASREVTIASPQRRGRAIFCNARKERQDAGHNDANADREFALCEEGFQGSSHRGAERTPGEDMRLWTKQA